MRDIIATHDEIKKVSFGAEAPKLPLLEKLLNQSDILSRKNVEANVCEFLSIIIQEIIDILRVREEEIPKGHKYTYGKENTILGKNRSDF